MSEPDDEEKTLEEIRRNRNKEIISNILSYFIGLVLFIIINYLLISQIGLFVILIDVVLILVFNNYNRYLVYGMVTIPILAFLFIGACSIFIGK